MLDRPLVGPRLVEGGWTLAPPGLVTLTRYPRQGVELPLPQADEAMLHAPDGSRFGFRGFVTLRPRPEEWRALHAASGGDGLRGVLLIAVRRAATEDVAPGGSGTASLGHSLERRFSDELARVGVDMRQLDVDSIDYLSVTGGGAESPTGAKVLVIGLDGLDWAIVDPLIAAGRMPNLARLVEHGTRAKLLSISPLLSPVVWTTIATGVEPSRHGVLDFLVEDPGTPGSRQPVTSAQRREPAVWELVSRSGIDVGVTAWWATWPADPVRGYVVSDRIAYQLFGYRSDPAKAQGKTWPPDLYPDVRTRIVAPDNVGWDRVTPYLGGDRMTPEAFDAEETELLEGLQTLLASGDTYLGIHEDLRRRFAPQLEIVYLEGTDTIGHLFMPYRPPLLPGIDPGRAESFGPIVDRYYETADAHIGRLLAGRDASWTVMVVSDHGFATDATRPRSTDSRIGHGGAADWHRRFGVLVLSGAHVEQGRIEEASVYDIAPTIMALFGQPIPRSWPGKVLAAAIDPGFLERHAVRFRTDDPVRKDRRADLPDDPGASELIEKLESLGYVSGASAGGDSVTAHNNAGVALLAEGRYADAETEFRAGIEAHPQAAMLRFNLAVALRYQGRIAEAIPLFEQSLTVPNTMRMAGHQLAQLRLAAGDVEGAESLVRELLVAEPEASELHNALGRILARKGDVEGARKAFTDAAGLDPDVALPRNNLGNLYRQRGRLDEAESWYLRAIEADPYFMGSYNNLALIYQDRGEMQRALDLYGRALAKSPNNAELVNNVGSWYFATGDFGEARKLWLRAAAVAPDYPSPLNNLAGLAITEGKLDDAERRLNRALALDPEYGDARINLAIVLRARGDVVGSREQLRLASADVRTGDKAWVQLGFLELENGFVDEAIAAFDRARGSSPQNVQTWNGLGEAYRRKGMVTEARAMWEQSLALRPDQSQVRASLESLDPS